MPVPTYITIDGDDIGRKVTACYIENDEEKLRELSSTLALTVDRIAKFLEGLGFEIIFSAADGIAGCSPREKTVLNLRQIHENIQHLAPPEITFSAGAGETMRDAYLALLYAKSSGKNTIAILPSSVQRIRSEKE